MTLASPPKRILLIKPSSLGDVVHALPVLNLLKRTWPDSQVSWLVTPACAGLLQGHPMLHEVILFERRRLGSAWWRPSAAFGLWRLHRELRRREFDLVIDLQGLFRSGWLSWQTRASHRIGFANARELAWIFYNQRVAVESIESHAVDKNLRVAAALGCDASVVEFPFFTDDGDERAVDGMLTVGQASSLSHLPETGKMPVLREYAVLLPATNWPTKRWPVEHFAALVAPLRGRFGLTSIVAGGPDAVGLASSIPGAIDLAGKTTLRQLVALLRRASLVIANDSGPMHIAAALGRPLVTMFGPTNPVRTGPYRRPEAVLQLDLPCMPCYSRRCSHQSCMRQLEPAMVMAAAERVLTSASPPAGSAVPSAVRVP